MKEDFRTQVADKLGIYNLLANIDDPELLLIAYETTREYETRLKQYSNGIISSSEHSRLYSINQLRSTKNGLLATFWALNKQDLHSLVNTSLGTNYFLENLNALERGVKIRRIFVLKRDAFIDSEGNFADEESLSIFDKLVEAGAQIRIAWIEEWDTKNTNKELYQDFGIFDDKKVCLVQHGLNNTIYEMRILKSRQSVLEYYQIYENLWSMGQTPEDIFSKYPRST